MFRYDNYVVDSDKRFKKYGMPKRNTCDSSCERWRFQLLASNLWHIKMRFVMPVLKSVSQES